jgi:acylphosphatase
MQSLRRYRVSGRVQGVAYRVSCRREALRLGLSGTARNMPDGSVEVTVAGAESAVQALAQWLWRGPELARVDQVECLECPPLDLVGFDVG